MSLILKFLESLLQKGLSLACFLFRDTGDNPACSNFITKS